jgi:hypothetical protein
MADAKNLKRTKALASLQHFPTNTIAHGSFHTSNLNHTNPMLTGKATGIPLGFFLLSMSKYTRAGCDLLFVASIIAIHANPRNSP